MTINLNEKVIVVTGASKGIGEKLARTFANEGACVVIGYCYDEILAQKVFYEISNRTASKHMMIRVDVEQSRSVQDFYKLIIERYKKVDVLVNNAGVCDDSLLSLMSKRQWDKVISTNLTGTFLCCKFFSEIMMQQKYGKIINIASIKGIEGCEGQVNYSASKGGIIALTKSLAKELGIYGISVNVICPGFIRTDLNKRSKKKAIIAKRRSVLSLEHATNDLVNTIILLSSDFINGISGQCFRIDSRLF